MEGEVDGTDLDAVSDSGSTNTFQELANRSRSQCEEHNPVKKGTLLKWTNYIQGWQERYVVLSNGTLSYYKSEFDTSFGCRGSMSLLMANVQKHEFDANRFDVSVTDCIYYLRCNTNEECQDWLTVLQQAKEKLHQDHGYGSDVQSVNSPLPLGRGNSIMSLNSIISNSSCVTKPSHTARLKEKVLEMETFRDLLQHQMDTLQTTFDECLGCMPPSSLVSTPEFDNMATLDDDYDKDSSEDCLDDESQAMISKKSSKTSVSAKKQPLRRLSSVSSSSRHQQAAHNQQQPCSNFDHRCCEVVRSLTQHSSDVRSELITFRATMAGVLSTLTQCSDMFQRKDDRFQRMLDHERDRRKRLECALSDCQDKLRDAQDRWHKESLKAGPDFQEGPHCLIREEEFLDAFEGELDRMEQEEHDRVHSANTKSLSDDSSNSKLHEYHDMLEEKLEENIRYCYEEVTNVWSVAFEDGDLKVYRRDMEEGGVVVDPFKAYHTVPGITAYELCTAFFDDQCRMDWETTIESLDVIDRYGDNTVVVHQLLKRVWPSSQREIVFLSAMRELPPRGPDERGFGYVVCNISVDHPSAPASGKHVRAQINVAMVAHTFVSGVEEGQPIDRSNLTCKITYSANVNPGGWAPPSVVRAISKREYPKFLRRFSSYAATRVENEPIQFQSSSQVSTPGLDEDVISTTSVE
ncbi:ceramide transfer protein-like [Sycon ciliatum]|uniref:ceramide transfer protein-like n=1 Tax=Sycon ciliatum TaxID=27933 RepID=UPI0020AD01FA|eukprot:scpid36397/ scgid21767/ Collagen type IV alpha-3-binding protein; Ceramide transfer protein